MSSTLIYHKDLKAETGISLSYMQVMRLVEAGKFPKPVKIGSRNYWVREELDQYLADKVADRDGLPRPPVPMPEYVGKWATALPKDGVRAGASQGSSGNQSVVAERIGKQG